MDLDLMLSLLQSKDTKQAYGTLLELERLSETSDELYSYTAHFADMVGSDRYAVRVRGFRLFCKQARWDTEHVLDQHMPAALAVLNDEKPTAVRQSLAALGDVVPYKRELWDMIRERAQGIDCLRYPDTMRDLIARDVCALLDMMEPGTSY